MFKRRWRRRIEEATIALLQPGENRIVGFPAEAPEAAPTSWLVDFLRRRYRVYVVVLTNSRMLVFSRIHAFSTFQLTWSEARTAVTVSLPTDGRLALRGEQLTLDLEVSPWWQPEAQLLRAELAR